MNSNYISIVGYGWTGSSLVVDLLKEFDGYDGLDIEFSMIWEPNGLLDLEKALIDDWDFLRHDTAIRDFVSYCRVLNSSSLFSIGFDLSNKLGVDFMLETHTFINRLQNFKYRGRSRLLDYELSTFKLFKRRVERKIFSYTSPTMMYMARPSREKFLSEAKIYMDNLFRNYSKNNNVSNIILDQSIPASNVLKTMNYFNNIKSIVIDRDPRDVYVNLIKRNALIGVECSLAKNKQGVEKFVQWHKILREQDELEQDKDKILRLNFEDIIMDYDNSVKKIIDFLDIKVEHTQKYKFFQPQISVKKIGLWKTFKNQEEIDYIFQELGEYCYGV